MSDCHCHHTSRKPNQTAINDVVLLGPALVAATLEQAGEFVRLLAGGISGSPSFSRSAGCCRIPETDCPPHCACEIEWEARAGEHLTASIKVTNTSQHVRAFQFVPTAFQGPGNPAAPLTVSPTGASLQPGQSIFLAVEFVPDHAFQPGQTYHAEIILKGAYDAHVCIVFKPLCERHHECHVAIGEPPVRLRPHQWYDHFQCAEPCFPTR